MEWNVGKIIEKRSMFTPDKEAFIFDDFPLSYNDLNERINRLANFLLNKGLKKGDRISVLLRDCAEILETYFAAAKLGLIFAPLNFRLMGDEIKYQLNNTEARLLIFHDVYTDVVSSIRSEIKVDKDKFLYLPSKLGDAPICPDWAENYQTAVEGFSTEEPKPDKPVNLDDPFSIIYTSGVTGAPKGALSSHEQTYFKIFHNIFEFDLRSDDVYLSQLPLFHSGGLFVAATPVLAQGATLVMRNSFDAEKFIGDIEKYKVTVIFALTTMWRFAFQSKAFEQTDVSSVRVIFAGGESKTSSLVPKLRDKFKGCKLLTGYGQTENSNMMFLPQRYINKMQEGSIGLSGFFSDCWVGDKQCRELPPGEIGEIQARGPNVMTGYWNMPDKTKETIVNGVLHTGDLAYRDEDGCFYIVDREKDMYRSGGENVYPAEIENVLVRHPKIFNVAIIGVPDERWGEVGMAFIVLNKGESMAEDEVVSFLKGKIAKYKFPKHIKFMKELPMTSSGKVKKVELKKRYSSTLKETA